LPADEYFVKAEREMKPSSFYGEFEQIENGIGLTTKFHAEAQSAIECLPVGNDAKIHLKKSKKTLIVSGVSAAKINRKLVEQINEKTVGLQAEILPVANKFFGETVTCTGLLTGIDTVNAILSYQEEHGKIDEVMIAGNMLMEFKDVFLCGMTLKQFKKKLRGVKVLVNRDGGYGFVQLLTQEKDKRK
jgi:NifB/MoaA-like Fe-S oxidoreductase